jgi:hypothetical protein
LPPKSLETTNIKTTVTLTDENAAGLAWAVDLTGLSLEEIINNLLADELTCFRPDYATSTSKTRLAAGNSRIAQVPSERLDGLRNALGKAAEANSPSLRLQSARSLAIASRLTLLKQGATASATGFAN